MKGCGIERGSLAARLRRDQEGGTAVLVAGSLFALAAAAAVAIDFGSIYLAKRRLQGIADAAAMAAANDPAGGGQALAQAIVDRSGAEQVTISSVTPGRYRRDATVALADRFTANAATPTAARVVLRQQVPFFFGVLLSDEPGMTIRADATASRTDLAAFSLGTRLAEVSGGIPNQLLSALAGIQLELTALDSEALANADIDILGFADALRIRAHRPDATYAELFDMDLPLSQIVGAMADATTGSAATVLSSVAEVLGTESVKLSDLIDLGPIGANDFNDGRTAIKVDAFSLLRSALELSRGDHYEIDLTLSALGLSSTKLTLVGGQGAVHSPWMTVTDAKDVVIRTAQARLYLDNRLANGPLGLVAVRLPVFIELAAAEARLSDIKCAGNPATDGVTLAVTPSVGKLAIADVDVQAMKNLTSPVQLQSAALAHTPLAEVKGYAEIALGGVSAQQVHFTKTEIADRRMKSVGTHDLATGATVSLVQNLQPSASLLGIPLLGGTVNLGGLQSAVGSLLGAAAPAVDGLLTQLTEALGIRLGVAQVRVDKMKCGVPLLVS